jgi:uncharacterized protein YuzE
VDITHDAETDAAYIHLTDAGLLMPGRESIPCGLPDGMHGWVVMDWRDGKITGLEVLDASALLRADLLAQARRLDGGASGHRPRP